MLPQILIATHNPWKYQLFGPIFTGYGFDVITLRDLPPQKPINESGSTVIENALIKAFHYHSSAHPWVFGDDTGLEVDVLDGEPGVQFRRWNGRFAADVDDQVWLDYLLKRMEGVPAKSRTAHFVDGWALIVPDGKAYTREIRATFKIASAPIRTLIPGSPVMCVAKGLPEDPSEIFMQAKSHWEEWGILGELLREDWN